MPELLEEQGWTYANEGTSSSWSSGEYASVPGSKGNEGLLLLGDELGMDGRHVCRDELLKGAEVFAVLQTMTIRGDDETTTVDELAQTLRDACAVIDGRLIASLVPYGSGAAPASGITYSAEVYKYAVRGKPCVWWGTYVRSALGNDVSIRVSVGISFLDYYARSRLIKPTYEAVADMSGPWDIDTSQEFQAMSVKERYRLGLL